MFYIQAPYTEVHLFFVHQAPHSNLQHLQELITGNYKTGVDDLSVLKEEYPNLIVKREILPALDKAKEYVWQTNADSLGYYKEGLKESFDDLYQWSLEQPNKRTFAILDDQIEIIRIPASLAIFD